MLIVKKNSLRYRDEDGNMQDTGVLFAQNQENLTITKESIAKALGYTPASEDDLDDIDERIDNIDIGTNQKLSSDNEDVSYIEIEASSGWTTEGWTGNFTNGFTHVSGNTKPLSFKIPNITAYKSYVVRFNSSVAYTDINILVTIGSAPATSLYDVTNVNTTVGITAVDNGLLTFTPSSDFVGTISNISIKEITGISTPAKIVQSSSGDIASEIRYIGENLFIGRGVGSKTIKDPNVYGNFIIGDSKTFQNNISGSRNIAIGYQSMSYNISGSRNTAIGANSLAVNRYGNRNTCIGNNCMVYALKPNRNVVIGDYAMCDATGSEDNVTIGYMAMTKNTTGFENVSIGSYAALRNETGCHNTAIGFRSMYNNTMSNYNVSIGYLAMYNGGECNGNVAIGNNALLGTTGSRHYNVAIGDSALKNANTVSCTVAIGRSAGESLKTGYFNIIIGDYCDLPDGTSYALNIGNLLVGSLQDDYKYLKINGGLRLPYIGSSKTANSDVYAEEWTFTLEDGSTVVKKVLLV